MEKTLKQAYRTARHHGERATRFEKVRFALVGVANTIVDFVVLISLVTLFQVPTFAANIVSTTAALIASFMLNKKAVFRGEEGKSVRQILLFLVVTLAGIWLVQTLVMTQLYAALQGMVGAEGWQALALLIAAKVVGIVAGSIWNYVWYSRVVFKKRKA